MVEIIKKIDNIYYLQIGVQGENLANAIQFDMSDWIAEHPSAHIHVLFKPYNSNVPAPVATQLDGNILTWRPSYTVTAVTGVGYTEVRAIDPDTGLVKKSRIIPTSVENSVSGTDGLEPPSPFDEWTNQVLAAADSAAAARAVSEAAAVAAIASKREAVMAKEAVEAERSRIDASIYKIDYMTAAGHTVLPGAGSSAVLTETGGHYHLELGLEQGAQGEPGRNAVVVALGAVEISFQIVNGHLIMKYGDDLPPQFSINSNGHLIYSF